MTVEEAIQRSIDTGSIVTLTAVTPAELTELETACDCSVTGNDGEHEFWADDSDRAEGMLWRVHARLDRRLGQGQ